MHGVVIFDVILCHFAECHSTLNIVSGNDLEQNCKYLQTNTRIKALIKTTKANFSNEEWIIKSPF
jgi:hypothetical protein